MTTRSFKILIERDQESDSWVTYVPALENISTFGPTKDEALENTRELILGYFEAAAKEGLTPPSEAPQTELVDLEIAIA